MCTLESTECSICRFVCSQTSAHKKLLISSRAKLILETKILIRMNSITFFGDVKYGAAVANDVFSPVSHWIDEDMNIWAYDRIQYHTHKMNQVEWGKKSTTPRRRWKMESGCQLCVCDWCLLNVAYRCICLLFQKMNRSDASEFFHRSIEPMVFITDISLFFKAPFSVHWVA